MELGPIERVSDSGKSPYPTAVASKANGTSSDLGSGVIKGIGLRKLREADWHIDRLFHVKHGLLARFHHGQNQVLQITRRDARNPPCLAKSLGPHARELLAGLVRQRLKPFVA